MLSDAVPMAALVAICLLATAGCAAREGGPARQVSVLVYGGPEWAADSVRILRGEGLADVQTVDRIEGAGIWQADVLVIPSTRRLEAQEGWRTLLREYVRGGGGLVLCHRSCGFWNEIDHSPFPRVAEAVDGWNDRRLTVSRDHEALGLPEGTEFSHGYLDHIQLRGGPDGIVLALDARAQPAIVVGLSGAGRVVFMGNGPDLPGPGPTEQEARGYASLVRWAAAREPRPSWQKVAPAVNRRIQEALSQQRQEVKVRFDASRQRLARRKQEIRERLRHFDEPHGQAEERLRECVVVAAERIREAYRAYLESGRTAEMRYAGSGSDAWIVACMYEITGEEEWADMARFMLTAPLERDEEQRPLGPFGIYPCVLGWSSARDAGLLSPVEDEALRAYIARSADHLMARAVRPELRRGFWHHNLVVMPAVGLVRTALEMPEHPHAIEWFEAGWAVMEHHLRDPKVYEDSSNYSSLHQNYLIFFAQENLEEGWPERPGMRELFEDSAQNITPAGWLPGYGDSHGVRMADEFLCIIEYAYTAYGDPRYRAIADRVLDGMWRLPNRPRAWYMLEAWLNHTPGPASFGPGGTVELQNRVVIRTGWGPEDSYVMLGTRDGKWGNRGSWHGHQDALAICALEARGKLLLEDSAYKQQQRAYHHGIIVHRGTVEDPLSAPDASEEDFRVYQQARVEARGTSATLTIENYDDTGVTVARTVELSRTGCRVTDRLTASQAGTYTIAQPLFAPVVEEVSAGHYVFDNPQLNNGVDQPPGPVLGVVYEGPSTRFATRRLHSVHEVRQVARVLVIRLEEGESLSLPITMSWE